MLDSWSEIPVPNPDIAQKRATKGNILVHLLILKMGNGYFIGCRVISYLSLVVPTVVPSVFSVDLMFNQWLCTTIFSWNEEPILNYYMGNEIWRGLTYLSFTTIAIFSRVIHFLHWKENWPNKGLIFFPLTRLFLSSESGLLLLTKPKTIKKNNYLNS